MDSMIKNLYDMELEELGRAGRMKNYCQSQKTSGKEQGFYQVEDKTGRGEALIWHFAIAGIGEGLGFTQGFKCALQLRTRQRLYS